VAKQDEIAFLSRVGEDIADYAAAKPFSDPRCGMYLVRIGTLMSLLPPRPARILDLGCGTGWTSLFFARAGYEVVGADIAPDMIGRANELRDLEGLSNASFVVSDYEALTFRNEFDAVVFFHSLHHADDEALAVRKAFAALKPGGVMLADEPGVGHSTSVDSLEAVAKYGVTEKDMPPDHVVALGRAAGFDAFRVFPCAESLAKAVYTERAEPLADPFADTDDAVEQLHATGLRRTCNRVLSRLRPTPAWRLTNVDHLLLHVRSDGLVMMRKPAKAARAAA
jgi:SAM-dependent methyltransferase